MPFLRSDISFDQISVVVQGPVLGGPDDVPEKRLTRRSLLSVREILPGAELILSTWAGTDTSELPCDLLLTNEDPGATPHTDGIHVNNVNRQIVSVSNGLGRASRPYALKLRSDSVLCSTDFLRYFRVYRARSSRSILQEKVVASCRGSFVPNYRMALSCYFPSDWFHFGLREDVQNIWDVALAPEPETTLWRGWKGNGQSPILRYAIEQYVWVTFLRKHYPVAFDSMFDQIEATIDDSEKSIAGNLVLISPSQAGIQSLKYPDDGGFYQYCMMGCYTHGLWRDLYARHCLNRRVSPWWFHRVFYASLYFAAERLRPYYHRAKSLFPARLSS
jgi:hypothetical protein